LIHQATAYCFTANQRRHVPLCPCLFR
jgi:hypothetical protein